MTDERLDELERLANAATPGPWAWRIDGGDHWASNLVRMAVDTPGRKHDGEVILDTAKTGLASSCDDVTAYITSGYSVDEGRPIAELLANFELLARSREAVPELIAEVRRLRGLCTIQCTDRP